MVHLLMEYLVDNYLNLEYIINKINIMDNSLLKRLSDAEKRITDLYHKIKKLISEGVGGVSTITGDFVDNTDPLNPVIYSPDLQAVTNEGSLTNHPITSQQSLGSGRFAKIRLYGPDGLQISTNANLINTNPVGTIKSDYLLDNQEYQLPVTGGTFLVGTPHKNYNGYLSQAVATDPPTFVEFEDDVAAGTWIRESTGNYSVTTSTPYVANKVLIPGFGLRQKMILTDGVGTTTGSAIYYTINNGGFVKIFLQTTDASNTLVDLANIVPSPILHLPELRIYN